MLRAGAAYLRLEWATPDARLASLLADARARHAVTSGAGRLGPGLTPGSAGSRVVVYMVPRDVRHVPGGRELRAFLAERLPGHMVPELLVVIDALPGPLAAVGAASAASAGRPCRRRHGRLTSKPMFATIVGWESARALPFARPR